MQQINKVGARKPKHMSWGRLKAQRLRAVLIDSLVLVGMIIGIVGANLNYVLNDNLAAYQAPTVPGESYQICNDNNQYLTSPWTYDALASGSQSYTVSQYEALNGYGTTLPPLPSYLANEPSTDTVATIFAPGGSASISPYNPTELYYIEGGNYPGGISGTLLGGDEVFGGSASGYPEPVGTGGGFGSSNSHFNAYPGYGSLAVAATGSTTITASSGFVPGGWNGDGGSINEIYFPDGTTVGVTSITGNTITLASAVTEAAGTNFWLGANYQTIGTVTTAAAAGSTTITTSAPVNFPYTPWDELDVGSTLTGGAASDSAITISSVSGDTLTLTGPLPAAVPANAPVAYSGTAGGVTIEYINVGNAVASGTNAFYGAGVGWTIEHTDIHDDYAGGANYATTNAAGQAINGISNGIVEYNCFQRFGEYALNGGGSNTVFDYNQVDSIPYNPDLSGNGQTGIGKWWGSLNNDIVDNTFTNSRGTLWFDNGNTGQLVQGNYFYNDTGRVIQNETGFNSEYTDNLFQDVNQGIYMNSSGGWNIPGSRYNDEIIISDNIFDNVVDAVNIWQASGRSCQNSGEAIPGLGIQAGNSNYCSDGFPNNAFATGTPSSPVTTNGTAYASHYSDGITGAPYAAVEDQTCTTSNPCGTASNPLLLNKAPALNDWLGFAGAAGSGTATVEDSGSVPATLDVSSTTGFTSKGELQFSNDTCVTYFYTSVISSTQLGGVSYQGGCNGGPTLTAGSDQVSEVPSYVTSTTDTTPVSDFGGAGNGSVTTLNVTSTAGFPSSGDLMLQTTAQTPGGGVGAVVSYSSIVSATQFGGVSLIKDAQGNAMGAGSLASGYEVEAVLPYQVTSVTCPGGSCVNNAEVEVSPTITSNITASQSIYNTGTCRFYVTDGSTPSSPLDPSGNPYWDDCQWQTRNITVENNTFYINPGQFNAANYPGGGTWGSNVNCQTGTSGNCGQNAMGYQFPGNAPYNNASESNAMMSNTAFAAPYNNLNASGSPLLGTNSYQANVNSETPFNDLWQNNTYYGNWTFDGYEQAATCTITWSGTALQWGGSGTDACYGLSLSQWQTYWQQDTSSTAHPMVVSLGLTANQEIYGNAQAVPAYEDTATAGGITSTLSVNGTTVSTLAASPYTFSLDTLPYADGPYSIGVSGTDSGGNSDSDAASVYIANGDLNGDGAVNLSDLIILAQHYGLSGNFSYAQGNITGSTSTTTPQVNLSDLIVLAKNYGWRE